MRYIDQLWSRVLFRVIWVCTGIMEKRKLLYSTFELRREAFGNPTPENQDLLASFDSYSYRVLTLRLGGT